MDHNLLEAVVVKVDRTTVVVVVFTLTHDNVFQSVVSGGLFFTMEFCAVTAFPDLLDDIVDGKGASGDEENGPDSQATSIVV